MVITTDGVEDGGGGGGLGPNTVGSSEIIDGSVTTLDIANGTITLADMAFNPFATGPHNRDYTVLNTSALINPNVVDLVLVDSTLGAIVVQLPATPLDGTVVTVKWCKGAGSVNIDGNGKDIDGQSSVSLDFLYMALELTYSSFMDEWFIT
jgi:hypothetical protein